MPRLRHYEDTYHTLQKYASATAPTWKELYAFVHSGNVFCFQHGCRVVVNYNKTIICGHWHSSYGHSKIDGKCSEFGKDAIFTPYYGKGIIAIDACTAHSGFINCIVLEVK